MAITKVSRNLLNTGVSDSSDATAITINSSEQVGIGETSPLGKLHVKTADSGGSADSGADELVLENSGAAGITILSGTANSGSVRFGDSDDNDNGMLVYNHGSSPYMRLFTGGSVRVRLDADGLKFGSDTAATNALDDYEEGTWSPTAAGVATAASYGARYTKIGQLVMAECYILINTQNNTDQFRIGGLPYTSHNVTAYGGGSIGYVGSSNLDFLTAPLIPGNASYAYFHYIDGQNSGASVTNNKMYSIESGNQLFIMQCFYRTA